MNRTSSWLPLYGDVFTNKKIAAAAQALTRGDHHKMVGHMAALWSWCMEFAQDGDLGHVKDRAIAQAAGWSGSASKFVNILKNSRLIDPDRKLHDWDAYAGRLIAKRAADAARKRLEYETKKANPPLDSPMETPRDLRTHSDSDKTVTVSNRTKEKFQTVSLAPSSSRNSRVVEAARTLVSIRANREGLYPCVLTPREAGDLVNRLLEDHDDALVFAGIESLGDASEGFESSTRVGQTKGIVAWVGRQKPPLLEVVKDLLSRLDGAPELCDEAGIPEDGVDHASNESLNALLDLVRQDHPELIGEYELNDTRLLA
jgi:hypothetical protein